MIILKGCIGKRTSEVNEMVRLENVIDIRTNQFYSVAIVKERNVRWFVPANEEETEE